MRAGAEVDLGLLAQETSAVVVCSTKAVSCLPAGHPYRLGHLGPGQRSDIADTIRQYAPDVVVVIGAPLRIGMIAPPWFEVPPRRCGHDPRNPARRPSRVST